ncbi:50S ribosomal protein L15e [Candidatus Marsarchaeota archaeon]|jgi:large subunit ribosomal protein L15e|nr:50S ribosomal protein L15e [Candidatus Marsarchaeota archaeon]MCL5090171.1 50S ribosomal protein L15e [Candidatus Marsarchaeota archaeon]
MGAYKEIRDTFIREYKEKPVEYKNRIVKWRSEPPIERIDKPTNIPRARKLGYKAKEGIIMARVKVKGGGKKRATVGGGRKPSKSGRYFTRAKSLQSIAEERASKKFSNCEVLNSYFVGKAGSDSFYEIIMLERDNAAIQNDLTYSNVIGKKGRAFRALTKSGRKHRGLMA